MLSKVLWYRYLDDWVTALNDIVQWFTDWWRFKVLSKNNSSVYWTWEREEHKIWQQPPWSQLNVNKTKTSYPFLFYVFLCQTLQRFRCHICIDSPTHANLNVFCSHQLLLSLNIGPVDRTLDLWILRIGPPLATFLSRVLLFL